MSAVKVASSDNLDIIYLIFGDVVRVVILDPCNHTGACPGGGPRGLAPPLEIEKQKKKKKKKKKRLSDFGPPSCEFLDTRLSYL